ncbi:MAG: M48 family metallopeptidase [Anaerolineae bacterium]|nr:M48 family metallopeptidase [Anaerolineae bacterium]
MLRDLACTVLLRDQGAHQETIRSYAAGEDFLDVVLAMELTTATAKDVTRGSHFDLEQVFERVNAAYFASELARPRLTWNRMITGNKYGHYDRHRDTVMISVTLDAPGVPDYAIDYVMYHELLHKQMGIDAIGGRNYAHTPKFRAAERRFPHYVEAQAFFTAAREAVMARR